MQVSWLFLAAILASSGGCTAMMASAMGLKQQQVGQVGETRTNRFGVCAFVDTSATLATATVKVCARTAKEDAADPSAAFVDASFTSSDTDRWNPGNWQVTVTDPGGQTLIDRTSAKEKTPFCLGTCSYTGRITVKLPGPWRAGTYQVRSVYLPDSRPFEMSITLQ